MKSPMVGCPLGLWVCAALLTSAGVQQVGAETAVADEPESVLELEVRLIQATPAPTLQRIAPYRDALATALYEVVEVQQGRFESKRVLVVRWVIKQDQAVPGLNFKPGTTEVLRLVRMDRRRDLRDRPLFDDTGMVDLELYFAVDQADEGNEQKVSPGTRQGHR